MGLIFIVVLVIMLFCSIRLRVMVLHPIKTIRYAATDIWRYYRYHTYDVYNGGFLNCYAAHFGGGKTLSVVHYICALYHRYNNKKVFDSARGKWVTQKVIVLSNVVLSGVPFEMLTGLKQIVECAQHNKKIDEENDTRTCVLVLLDEASAMLNSREFKTNITPDFLNSLLTCRHYHLSFYYTSQKFKLVDALLRSVTQRVIWCDKWWRIMVHHEYDADEMEYTSNPLLVQPLVKTGFFITDKDYAAYDTLAVVERLEKAVDKNDLRSEEEILLARGQLQSDLEQVNPSKKLKRRWKKRR